MVTAAAAEILRIERGEIREDGAADLVVIRDPGCSPGEALLDLREVEMVIVAGKIRLVSRRLAGLAGDGFEPIAVAERGRFLIDAPVARLYQEAVARLGTALRLAGRPVRIK